MSGGIGLRHQPKKGTGKDWFFGSGFWVNGSEIKKKQLTYTSFFETLTYFNLRIKVNMLPFGIHNNNGLI